jgi:hypothetical protein
MPASSPSRYASLAGSDDTAEATSSGIIGRTATMLSNLGNEMTKSPREGSQRNG